MNGDKSRRGNDVPGQFPLRVGASWVISTARSRADHGSADMPVRPVPSAASGHVCPVNYKAQGLS
jgi:hypothetical protein